MTISTDSHKSKSIETVDNYTSKEVVKLIKNKNIICSWCFDILKHKLNNKEFYYVPNIIQKLHDENFKIPFFIKWMRLDNPKYLGSYNYDNYELKGCIGCLSKIDILDIQYYTLQSALHDTRFYSITLKDLPYLIVTITYLYNFEKCKHVHDWTIGRHGIIISFTVNRVKYSSTFLPEVALQHKYDHKTTLKKLIRKANYAGDIDDDLLKIIKVEKYEGTSCSLTYVDYEKLQCQ
ncbi:conserved protein, unknown function [Hepatocystis sp. ex Piliocolobus tephrosceles]|nr:conserved protein, unknown function [Hepatocystis sp. ex Piliocolobus tephrosceles]